MKKYLSLLLACVQAHSSASASTHASRSERYFFICDPPMQPRRMRRPLFFPAYHTGARRATLTLPGAYAKMMNAMNGKSTPITRSQRGARTLRGCWPAGRNVRLGARREEMPARRHRVTVRRARNESGTAKDFASHAGRHGGAFLLQIRLKGA